MLGEIISGITGLFNGFQNRNATQEANQANLAQARENNAVQKEIAQQNIANQREFAQQGIRWKVEDAQAAGLHPLAALGAQVSSFSPISVGTSAADIKPAALNMPDMGQNISRAMSATRTGTEKVDAYTAQLQALQLERGSLENTLLKSQILRNTQPAAAQPNFPSIADTPPNFIPVPRPGPPRTMSGDAITDDKIEQKPSSDFPVKTLRMYGLPIEMPSWLSSGQDWEDALGEVGGSAMGLANLPGIIGHNVWSHGSEFQKRMGESASPSRAERRAFARRVQSWR